MINDMQPAINLFCYIAYRLLKNSITYYAYWLSHASTLTSISA